MSLFTKLYGLQQLIIVYTGILFNCAISIDHYTSIHKFYSFVISRLLRLMYHLSIELSCFNTFPLHMFSIS